MKWIFFFRISHIIFFFAGSIRNWTGLDWDRAVDNGTGTIPHTALRKGLAGFCFFVFCFTAAWRWMMMLVYLTPFLYKLVCVRQ
jgi:hypothetical protein